MIRRELLQLATPFDDAWVHDEWPAIIAASAGGVAVLREPLIQYRQHGANVIGARSWDSGRKPGGSASSAPPATPGCSHGPSTTSSASRHSGSLSASVSSPAASSPDERMRVIPPCSPPCTTPGRAGIGRPAATHYRCGAERWTSCAISSNRGGRHPDRIHAGADSGARRIPGAWEITPVQHHDDRGSHSSSGTASTELERGDRPPAAIWAQAQPVDLPSRVVRGIHFADVPPGQAKYVTVPRGPGMDYIIDPPRSDRRPSPSGSRSRLDDVDRRAVYIAEGLGHCFVGAGRTTPRRRYLVSSAYNPNAEHDVCAPGSRDRARVPVRSSASPCLSDKDRSAPRPWRSAREAGRPPTWRGA